MRVVARGDIIFANLGPSAETAIDDAHVRPALIVSSDAVNEAMSSVLVCPLIEATEEKKSRVGATYLAREDSGLGVNCLVLSFQVWNLEKNRIVRRITSLPRRHLEAVDEGLKAAFDLD